MKWEEAILNTLYSLSGTVALQDIYRGLSEFINLTPEHWRETKYGNRPAFQHQVRSYISNLCQNRKISRVARGRYKLTQEGLRAISKL